MGGFSANSSHNPAVTLEETASSRSFLSRFTLPIRSRARNITDFHIRAAEPHRKYAAGDHVEGAVHLTVVKPIRITHLTVALHGFVRVFKAPSGANNEAPFNPAEIPTSGATKKSKFFGHGHASLFQDEQVLSADGKLEPGNYQFGFDLMFPLKGLPSSIDFERGTISYMITATLTRPTTMSPTQTCERKIYLMEKVDIGSLTPPRPRTIYLEPISKRSRRRKPTIEKTSPTAETPEPQAPVTSDIDSNRATENSTEGSVIADDTSQDVQYTVRSPNPSDMHSEVSGESAVSESTGRSGKAGHDPNLPGATNGPQGAPTRTTTTDDRTITATIELLKGGCLPGDVVPVRISVSHIKRIKSMHGVVVTLYRQGRIDSDPPISSFTDLSKEEIRRLEKEEYYPKSKTGLGGLSLTSTSSYSVFRKDLSQCFSPLIIDPVTLKSSVTTSVRVPEDSFPTIKGVPGEMITFKYQLEVIVDLGGKLASLLQSGQAKGGTTPSPSVLRNPYEQSSGQTSWGGSMVDTDQLRRQKGVISVVYEIVVGTLDSGRQRDRGLSQTKQVSLYPSQPDESERKASYQDDMENEDYRYEEDGPYPYPEEYTSYPEDPAIRGPDFSLSAPGQPAAPFYVPPPEIVEEASLTEKERIRRAEERLLPSQPLGAPTAGPSNTDETENMYDAEDGPSAPALPSTQNRSPPETEDVPSAPALEDLAPAALSHPTEDKQELERRRLLAEASSPPEFPDDYDAGVGASSSPPGPSAPHELEPSAPTLSDEEEYGPHYAYNSPAPLEPLPRYER